MDNNQNNINEEPVVEQPVMEPTPVEPVVEPTPIEPVPTEPVVEPTPVEPVMEQPVMESTPVEPVPETPVEPSPEVPPMQPVQPVAPAPEKKKSHVGLIIGLVVGIPVLLLVLFMIAMLVFGSLFVKKVGEELENGEHQITLIDDGNGNHVEIVEDNNSGEKEEDKEEEKEEPKQEEKKEEEKKEEKKEETKPSTTTPSAQQPASNPTPQQPSATEEPTTASPGEIEEIPGTVLYLYEDSTMGMDGASFEYVSHTDSEIVVNVSINEGTPKKYTFKYGQEYKVDGVKNKIAITLGTYDDAPQFSITFN